MSLVQCPDCEAQVSDAASACPQCGRPQLVTATITKVEKDPPKAFGCAFVGFIVGCCGAWGGCGHFGVDGVRSQTLAFYAFAGAIFAILGAILGAVVDHARK